MVQLRQLQSFPLPATFVPKIDIVKWSFDNQVVILHRKGGVVYDLSLDPCQDGPEVVTAKSVLPSPPQVQNLSTVYINDNIMVGGTKNQFYDLLRDRILTPRGFDGIEFNNYFSKVDWSSLPLSSGPLNKPRCVLATLTSNFHMTIYTHLDRTRQNNSEDKSTDEWVTSLDISKLYNGIMYHKWTISGENSNDLRFPMYKSRLYELTTIDFVWMPPFVDDDNDHNDSDVQQLNEAFLITAQANGDILIWWIVVSPDSGQLTAEPVFTKSVAPNEIISVMKFQRTFENVGIFAIGTNSGIVKVFRLEKLNNEMENPNPVLPKEPKFRMNDGFEIWEKDLMRIDFLETTNSPKARNILKGPTVNLLIAKHPNYLLSTLITISTDDIDFKPVEEFQTPEGPFVGLSHYSEDKFMLSHEGGFLSWVVLRNGSVGCIDEVLSIADDNFSNPNEAYLFNGLTFSPNRTMACVGKHLSCTFDHLAVRDPARLAFLSLLPEDNPLDFVNDLYVENQCSLPRITDALIALRSHIRLSENLGLTEMSSFSTHLGRSPISEMYAEELRIYFWVTKALIFPEVDGDKFTEFQIQALRDSKSIILRHHLEVEDAIVRKHFATLLNSVEDNKALPDYKLTGKNAESFHTVRKYLASKSERVPALPESLNQAEIKALCPLCASGVDFMEIPANEAVFSGFSWESQACAKKHRFPVCILSLLPCEYPYRNCSSCHVNALMTPVFCQRPICPLCGEFMLPLAVGGDDETTN